MLDQQRSWSLHKQVELILKKSEREHKAMEEYLHAYFNPER